MGVIIMAQGVQLTYKLTFLLETSRRPSPDGDGVPVKQGAIGSGQGHARRQLDEIKARPFKRQSWAKLNTISVNKFTFTVKSLWAFKNK